MAVDRVTLDTEGRSRSRRLRGLLTEDLAREVLDPVRDIAWRTQNPVAIHRGCAREALTHGGSDRHRHHAYLLASKSGAERTDRLSQVQCVESRSDRADRPDQVDLARLWAERAARSLADKRISVVVRMRLARCEELMAIARGVQSIEHDGQAAGAAGRGCDLNFSFEDVRHAVWAVWQLDSDADVLDRIGATNQFSTRVLPDSSALNAHSKQVNLVLPAGGAGEWMTNWKAPIAGPNSAGTAPQRDAFIGSELPPT